MRRVNIILILSIFVITSLIVPATYAKGVFKDVDGAEDRQSHWASTSIYDLFEKGLVNGYPQGEGDALFKPDNIITRAEFMAILTMAFNVYDKDKKTAVFGDVADNDWFMPYIASGVEMGFADEGGIASDVEGNALFAPEQIMSREQMMTFTGRALEKMYNCRWDDNFKVGNYLNKKFSDYANIDLWAIQGVSLCVGLGLVEGYIDNEMEAYRGTQNRCLKPNNSITRGEVCKIVSGIVSRPQNGTAPSIAVPTTRDLLNWSDIIVSCDIIEKKPSKWTNPNNDEINPITGEHIVNSLVTPYVVKVIQMFKGEVYVEEEIVVNVCNRVACSPIYSDDGLQAWFTASDSVWSELTLEVGSKYILFLGYANGSALDTGEVANALYIQGGVFGVYKGNETNVYIRNEWLIAPQCEFTPDTLLQEIERNQ